MIQIHPQVTLVCTYSQRDRGLEYIEAMIRSVATQDYDRLSLLLYADGVRQSYYDAVEEILSLLPGLTVTHVHSEMPRQGRAKALGSALRLIQWKQVRCHLFGLIDSDDYLPVDHAITNMVGRYQSSEANAVYSNRMVVDADDQPLQTLHANATSNYSWRQCLMGAYPFHLTLWESELLTDVEIDRTLSHAVDYDLALKLLEKSPKLTHLDEVCYAYRHHPDQMSTNKDEQVLCSVRLVRASIARKNSTAQVRMTYVIV